MKIVFYATALAVLSGCAAAKVEDFSAISGVQQANKDQAYIICLAQAEQHGAHARTVSEVTTPGFVAVGSPEFVGGAALGHALGSAIRNGTAYANARDNVLAACMAQAGYMKTPQK